MNHAMVYDDYGPADCLRQADLELPKCGPREVLIRVHAASINPIDVRLRSGEAKWIMPGGFPRVPGYDVAGEIIESNSASHLRRGDRVLAFLDHPYGGGYASYAKCSAVAAAKIPDAMSFDEAAAIPLAGSTALQSLRDKASIHRGDRVLINGASGGVGVFAVQIAKAYGAEVTGVASGPNEEFVRSLGADDFIDHRQEDFTKLDRSWEIIFDAAGKSSYWKSRRVLAKSGRFVSTEPSAGGILMTVATWMLPKRGCVMLARPNQKDLADLVRLYESGEMKVTIADVLPLERASDGQRKIEQGGHRGKLILTVSHNSEVSNLAP